jgi:hypothetical protein
LKYVILSIFVRPLSAPSGGLCGLASLYLALSNTLLTKSQLAKLNYTGMREKIGSEMLLTDLCAITDTQLLRDYYTCKLATKIDIAALNVYTRNKM